MNLNIALLPGDGVGPEVTAQAVKCLQAVEEAFGHRFRLTEAAIGAAAMAKSGDALPAETILQCKRSDAVLLGVLGDPKFDRTSNVNSLVFQALPRLRKELGLYCNIRPVKVFPTVMHNAPLRKPVLNGTDFVIYREVAGGLYNGEQIVLNEGTGATDTCTYTESEISRIAHLAFKAAKGRRGILTMADKSDALETSRLWRRVVSRVGESYPEVRLELMPVEVVAMQIILKPSQFDVLLTQNMFGEILADEAAAIGGSMGLLPSAIVGENNALFEPIMGGLAQPRGKNGANPIASILCVAMMMEHFGLKEETQAIVMAVYQAMKKNVVTPDLDPKAKYGTEHVGEFIANNIADSDELLSMNKENIGLGKSTII
jgi:3-isopropylmalate dehydrogenase